MERREYIRLPDRSELYALQSMGKNLAARCGSRPRRLLPPPQRSRARARLREIVMLVLTAVSVVASVVAAVAAVMVLITD